MNQLYSNIFFKKGEVNSLAVHWLGLGTFTAGARELRSCKLRCKESYFLSGILFHFWYTLVIRKYFLFIKNNNQTLLIPVLGTDASIKMRSNKLHFLLYITFQIIAKSFTSTTPSPEAVYLFF